ncbi:hypothetical protein MsAg5_13070 [Methanosarcinaceae archaeon Ag5]|uniref:DUF927 domain-containing protein n=1 Tax=Methanolapillus africanus TaxID=3028297 RepID=A0AAE4MJ54_9EURY|nr:hypothetical protein [Methanosarcinaceae archaeon Ag5]
MNDEREEGKPLYKKIGEDGYVHRDFTSKEWELKELQKGFWPWSCDLQGDIEIVIHYSKKSKTKFSFGLEPSYQKELQMMNDDRKKTKKKPEDYATAAKAKLIEKLEGIKGKTFPIKNLMNPTDDELSVASDCLSEYFGKTMFTTLKFYIGSCVSEFREIFPEEYERLWPEHMYQSHHNAMIDPSRWIVDRPYKIDYDNGKLYRLQYDKNNDETYENLISDLVVVTAEFQDLAEDDEIYFRYHIKNGRRAPRNFLMSASKITDKEFLDDIKKRVIVISGEEKHFTRFLTLFAMQNRDMKKIDHYYFSSRTGWAVHDGKKYFMLGDRYFDLEFNNVSQPVPIDEMSGMAGYEEFFAGISDSGDYAKWIAEWVPALTAKDIEGRPIFMENTNLWVTIYGLSASFLMDMFPGIENTLIINSGTTSRGKSTIAKIAASLFGNPKKFITLGSGTANGIWSAWLKWDYLPSIMDEFTNTREDIKANIPYWFSDGKEKSRLNKEAKARKINEFHKIGYISLENDFVNRVMRSGIDARVIPIFDGLNLPAAESDDVNTSRATLIDNLARIKCHEHYGFFKYELLKTIGMVGTDRITDLYDKVSKEYATSGDALASRLGSSFALFHVSGILVEMTNVRLKIREPMDSEAMNDLVKNRCLEILDGAVKQLGDQDWQAVLVGTLSRADHSESRTRWLTDDILENPYNPRSDYGSQEPYSPIKYSDQIEAWFSKDGMIEYVDISTNVVEYVCQTMVGKPSMKNVLKEWADKKILFKGSKDGQYMVQQRHHPRQGEKKVRTYVYRINLAEANKLCGYDLTVRRRELIEEVQSEISDYDENNGGEME